jgi:hypothetical protein
LTVKIWNFLTKQPPSANPGYAYEPVFWIDF